ncbi:MAG: GMC family oxidoreductase [Bdellovibrionales bacterium]|nr:GMC family oxidoreductase [Bdellovibrionales bacterium]
MKQSTVSTTSNNNSPNDLSKIFWDVIVIGTGISGGTIGYSLAKSGKLVLFLEKGLADLTPQPDLIRGSFPESHFKNNLVVGSEEKEILTKSLRCTEVISDLSLNKNIDFIPFLGQGAGGSSSIYGAAMERFFPADFEVLNHISDVPNSTVVNWPINYFDLEPYYTQAEALYNVFGSPDPLRLPFQSASLAKAPLSPAGNVLFNHWTQKGYHPYRLPVAHKPHHISQCAGCQGTLCKTMEKIGSYEACVQPALKLFNAKIIDQCEVLGFIANSHHIDEVLCLKNKEQLKFKGKKIILAAGAIFTPALLLKSKSSIWPQGLANRSGLVGKNLCRHFLDLFIINLNPLKNKGYFEKELAINDFYFSNGTKLGTIQSLGNPPEFKPVIHEMHYEIPYHNYMHRLQFNFIRFFGKRIYENIMKTSLCLAGIMEDFSYAENQVGLTSSEKIFIKYQLTNEARNRLKLFRALAKKSLKPYKVKIHPQGENNQRLAHASGTCRMGINPEKSVVDSTNRAHDLDNLYIVDASFFPSSSGINPSLTLAANALRVAKYISS